MAKRPSRVRTYNLHGKQVTQTDYVERGSDDHARVLGLQKATDEDRFVYKGWALRDITMFGATAQDWFIEAQLRSKVNELTTEMPPIQDKDPFAENYAPPMFDPDEGQTRIVPVPR